MNHSVFIQLANNALLLLAMGFLYDVVIDRCRLRPNRFQQVGIGIALAILGIGVILTPWTFAPGIFFDTRSVLLAISGLFFGTLPTLIALAATAAFRLSQGGAVVTGVSVIVASGLFGIAWRRYRPRTQEIAPRELYLFGVVVHLVMLALMFLLPWRTAVQVLADITLPVMLIYPVATLLLGQLLVIRQRRGRLARALQESEERYRSLFENSHTVMLLIDPADGAVVDANPAAVIFYGWSRDELCRKKIADINTLPPQEIQTATGRTQAGATPYFQSQHRLADGSIRQVEIFCDPLAIAGRPLLFSIVQDATEKRQAESGLKMARFCIENAAIGIFRIDGEEGRIVEANARICANLGYPREELCALTVFDVDAQVNHELWRLHQKELASGGFKTIETLHRRKDGTTFPVEITISCHRYEGQNLCFCFVQDISDRKDNEKRLVHLATLDELTGLANRNLLFDRLEQSIYYANRSQRLVAILLIDLDRFKVVNDSLGHTAGDELLCMVARRLLDTVRAADTVARLGGDEFAILLTEVAEEEHVVLTAEKILAKIIQPYAVAERWITVTPSIGISLYPRDGGGSEMLLRNADIAMYRAKEEGNTFRFYAKGMNQRMMDTLEVEADLRHAIERDELRLYYQPKVDLASGHINGCEALLRWQHPHKGLLAPDSFIGLAEETGLILPIGEWVLAVACAQVQDWLASGLPVVPVSVNLSARQFSTGDLLETVQRIMHDSGIDPRLLELELTESMIMLNPEATAATLHRLKHLGLRLALDDFGTGYSSLNYLRRFPFDCLKIDRSFIHDVATDPSAAAVTTSIVAIARSLGLHAVAEGVETRDQLDFLVRSDCDTCQGYYFSKPVPADVFAAMLREKIYIPSLPELRPSA
ncbi:MAG: EAL domain-containing protein [Desulfuromonadales bacterium]